MKDERSRWLSMDLLYAVDTESPSSIEQNMLICQSNTLHFVASFLLRLTLIYTPKTPVVKVGSR